MPEYTLRNVDPHLWGRFTERANHDGWPLKALFVSLLEAYANGEFTPAAPPPREVPEFAWLRSHYRTVVQEPDFESLDAVSQWERLLKHVLHSSAAMSWRMLDDVPIHKRPEILGWLSRTSNVEVRHVLTLRAIAHVGEGPDLRTNRRAFQYEVLGLPLGQQAWIADFDGGWRILRVIDGRQGHWGNPHETKDAALDSLGRMIKDNVPDDSYTQKGATTR